MCCVPLYIFIVHYPNVQLDLDAVIKLWQPHRFTKPATGHWHHFILHFALVMVFLVFKFLIFIFQNSNCDLKVSLSATDSVCHWVCISFSISPSLVSFSAFLRHVLRLSITIVTLFTFIAVGIHIVTNEKYHSKTEHREPPTQKSHRRKIKAKPNNTFRKFSPYFFSVPGWNVDKLRTAWLLLLCFVYTFSYFLV